MAFRLFGFIALGVACLSASGCASALTRGANEGEFRRYSSQHFDLVSDGLAAEAGTLLTHLERTRTILEGFAFPYQPRLQQRMQVAMFSSLESFEDLAESGQLRTGFYNSPFDDYLGLPQIMLSGKHDPVEVRHIAAHELTHRFAAHHMPSAPVWLQEGLAEYYETIEFSDGGRVATIGQHLLAEQQRKNTAGVYQLRATKEPVVPATELRAMSASEFYGSSSVANYASAWALVHVLSAGKGRPIFSSYLDALQAGQISEREAWQTRWGGVADEVFVDASLPLIDTVDYSVERVVIHLREDAKLQPVQSKALSLAEANLFLSRAFMGHNTGQSSDYARKAARLEPKNPEPELFLGVLAVESRIDDAIEHFRRAYELSNQGARYGAALLYALESKDPPESTRVEADAIAARLTHRASSSQELVTLATHLGRSGRLASARRYAIGAIAADPSRGQAYYTLALIDAAAGQSVSAIKGLVLAENLAPHGQGAEGWRKQRQLLCEQGGAVTSSLTECQFQRRTH